MTGVQTCALPISLVSGEFDLILDEEYPGFPPPRARETERRDLFADDLRLAVPVSWNERSLAALAARPFVMEPARATAREWATAVCRQAGFEPDVRYTSTDLQVHLRLVESGLAAALLPGLAGAARHPGVQTRGLPGRPRRQIFTKIGRAHV